MTPWSKFDLNQKFFTTNSCEKFWLIGLLGADGSIHKKGYTVLSQSGEYGYKILNYIKTITDYNGNINKYKNSYRITITDKSIAQSLSNYGVVSNKTLTYKPKNIPKKYFKSFLRGYFEGDGSVGRYKVGNSKDYLCCSFVGTNDFINYIEDRIPKNYRKRKITRCKNLCEIRYNGKNAYSFLKWLYSNNDLYKSYKYEIYKNWIDNNQDFVKNNKKVIQALALYNGGMNCNVISKELNISFQKVYKWRSNGFKHF